MSDGSSHTAKLRERLTTGTEDKLGRALADLLDNPLVTGTIGRAFDARERAAQAQELALSALNIPTAADIERLTRRLRSVSQRLEGIEDGVHRINRALTEGSVERRLAAMEEQLKLLSAKLAGDTPKKPASEGPKSKRAPSTPLRAKPASSTPSRAKRASSTPSRPKRTSAKAPRTKQVAPRKTARASKATKRA
ncbi:MAG TPA: hypothetical protein VNX67_08035 [Solirubrobacteraceae bacterium]|jgi:hypothetical protein|nr:hypothetical protein [Solirubrobacteraceae bacterium]